MSWEAKCDQYFFLNPCGWGSETDQRTSNFGDFGKATEPFMKGLIPALNERWRRGLGMQVERAWFSGSGQWRKGE